MIPARRLTSLALLWALLAAAPLLARALAPGLEQNLLLLWAGTGAVMLLTAGIDLARGRLLPVPEAQRQLPAAFSVQVRHRIRLRLLSPDLPARVRLADEHPGDDPDTGLPADLDRQDATWTELSYHYRPAQRGRAAFGDILIWRPSPLGLWWVRQRVEAGVTVPVYPDFSMLETDGLRASHPHSRLLGSRRRPRRGEGLEFHQLREYQPGDSIRQIDWKATARRRALISREYQEEQNQQLVVLLDGGQRLALPVAGLTGFDHGLNASLLLAWSALGQGDRPGALVFSGREERWIPPVRGRNGVNRLLNRLYDLHPSEHTADFTRAARRLTHYCHRRALVVLVTRLQPDDSDDLLAALQLLRRRHLVLVADMRLPAQAELAHRPVDNFEDALLVTGDATFEEERQALYARLRHAGAIVVDATPARLPGRLNTTYLALKNAGRL